MSINSSLIADQNITFVSSQISYRNPEAVETFLADHPEIENFLKEAWSALATCFDEAINILLEVITDPDQPDSAQLVGWIQWTGAVNEGLARLDQFDEAWFLDHLTESDGKFNFNIETK